MEAELRAGDEDIVDEIAEIERGEDAEKNEDGRGDDHLGEGLPVGLEDGQKALEKTLCLLARLEVGTRREEDHVAGPLREEFIPRPATLALGGIEDENALPPDFRDDDIVQNSLSILGPLDVSYEGKGEVLVEGGRVALHGLGAEA